MFDISTIAGDCMEIDDLKLIKKHYGEKMAHLCRELFSTILEQKGALYEIISKHFSKSKSLYYDIVSENKEMLFKEYVYSFFDAEKTHDEIVSKSVKELLEEKGYVLYECKTFEDVLKFKKYYAPNEELCTFRDANRIKNHYIFFIVKKDVETIRREDFSNPKREDCYGVSVLDLQFDKGARQRVSIKSRYNHRVNNPDATYSNNLERIAPSLTGAFERDYNFHIERANKVGFELEDYVKARDGKYYKYNYEINNIHYCLDNIIIDNGEVIDRYSDKSRYTFMDYFILDESEKKIILYDKDIRDSFADDIDDIESIEIGNNSDEGYKKIILVLKDGGRAIVKLDKRERIIGYKNDNMKTCEDDFLYYNKSLITLDLPMLKVCGDNFLFSNESLITLNLPKLEECNKCFLYSNTSLTTIDLPKLRVCGDFFLLLNSSLTTLKLSKLRVCGSNFLGINKSLKVLDLPELEECDKRFLYSNTSLTTIDLSMLKVCGDAFLFSNESLTTLNLPKLEECNDCFLKWNTSLKTIDLPMLKVCGDDFLSGNKSLVTLNLPKLERCGHSFLFRNTSLKTIDLPRLKVCGYCFLNSVSFLASLNLPEIDEKVIDRLRKR